MDFIEFGVTCNAYKRKIGRKRQIYLKYKSTVAISNFWWKLVLTSLIYVAVCLYYSVLEMLLHEGNQEKLLQSWKGRKIGSWQYIYWGSLQTQWMVNRGFTHLEIKFCNSGNFLYLQGDSWKLIFLIVLFLSI